MSTGRLGGQSKSRERTRWALPTLALQFVAKQASDRRPRLGLRTVRFRPGVLATRSSSASGDGPRARAGWWPSLSQLG